MLLDVWPNYELLQAPGFARGLTTPGQRQCVQVCEGGLRPPGAGVRARAQGAWFP